jgi:hypothetical protein
VTHAPRSFASIQNKKKKKKITRSPADAVYKAKKEWNSTAVL